MEPIEKPNKFPEIRGAGARLVAAREALGYKQAEFARLLKVSASKLANWEGSEQGPPARALAFLKRAYGISADWILCGDPEGLERKVLRQLVALGANNKAPMPARELRQVFPHLPDPAPLPMAAGFAEPSIKTMLSYVRIEHLQLF